MIGEYILLAPPHLLGDKRVDPRVGIEFRHVPVIPERIGVPSDLHLRAELLREIPGRIEKMMHPRLSAREIAVGLDPHPSDDLPPAVLHALLHSREHVGSEALPPVAARR